MKISTKTEHAKNTRGIELSYPASWHESTGDIQKVRGQMELKANDFTYQLHFSILAPSISRNL